MSNEFSVSMCVYGGDNAAHFDAALSSVIEQTLKPTEIVLTVDGPIPESIEAVINKFQQTMNGSIAFKVIRLEKNVGHGEARRVCFDNCSCDLIALMDADDISVPERFQKQIHYFSDHPDVSVVGGYITEFITADDPMDISQKAGSRIVPEADEEIKQYMKKRCPMNQVTVMFKKDDVAEVGGYIDWYCEEDYYLWIRLALAGKQLGNIPENKSEANLQRYMLSNSIISFPRYLVNICERLSVQLLMPNKVRGWVFQKLARN